METTNLPEVSIDDINFLQEYDYYDGVTCGIIEWKGLPYYFNWVDEDRDQDTRLYYVYAMTDEQTVYFHGMDDWWDFCQNLDLTWEEWSVKFYDKYPSSSWPQFKRDQAIACFWL